MPTRKAWGQELACLQNSLLHNAYPHVSRFKLTRFTQEPAVFETASLGGKYTATHAQGWLLHKKNRIRADHSKSIFHVQEPTSCLWQGLFVQLARSSKIAVHT